jgi:hypothetical protein
MRRQVTAWGTAVLCSMVFGAAGAGPAEAPGVVVTIYRPNAVAPPQGQRAAAPYGSFAVVTDRRKLAIGEGGEVRFPGVSAVLDPASVQLRDLTEPDARVGEQGYEYDLGTSDGLLKKYIGQKITLVTEAGEKTGVLRWFDASQIVIETDDPVTPVLMVSRQIGLRDIKLGPTPGGLVSTPTLRWKLAAKKGGEHVLEATYQTEGLAWDADYLAVVDEDGKKLELSGWVTVFNTTGSALGDVVVRLVSGEPARGGAAVGQGQTGYDYNGYPIQQAGTAAPPLRVYELGRTVSIPSGGQKQLELFPTASGLAAQTVYVYEYTPQYAYYYKQQGYQMADQYIDGNGPKKFEQVGTSLEVDLSSKAGPKGALPPGLLRVYKKDAKSGGMTLVAEDNMGETAVGGRMRVRLGSSKDVSGERRQVEFRYDDRNREMREKFEIRLKNSRKEAIEVVIPESLFRWRTWVIEGESAPYERSDNNERASFRVKVPASGEATLTYTAKYSW